MNRKNNLLAVGLIALLVIASVGAIRTQAHRLVFTPLSVTIAANAGSRPDGVAVYTVVSSSDWKSANYYNCADTGGCYVYITETNVRNGQVYQAFNASTAANNVTIFDTSGVRELSGNWVGGQRDSMEMQYMVDRWVQTSESDN